ncbi:MAG: outer membrane beta-barrel protein [Acidobacteria bacterium]|nr:outer membrane beta-barrel protein [Acidobacteriota bacterium]
MLLLLCSFAPGVFAQQNLFVGGYVGVSTVSADARTDVATSGAQFSSYKPENGLTAVGFAGRHLSDWFSVMGSYGWNRNSMLLAVGDAGPVSNATSREYASSMRTAMGEALFYFRPRRSRIRPYLSAGAGLVNIHATSRGAASSFGRPPSLPDSIDHTGAAVRVAVGIDLFVSKNMALRYSFSETIQGNPFSTALTPTAPRDLANFQNWLGMAFHF